jgi:hypothetical protein
LLLQLVNKIDFQFFDFEYKTDLAKDTDDYFRGKGHLMLFNREGEDSG